MRLPITSVVAVTPSWGIGNKGTVPWAMEGLRLNEDLAYFRRCTTATANPQAVNACIMGRLTWESIPQANKPLKKRINIIVSSHPASSIYSGPNCLSNSDIPQVYIAKSFQEALDIASSIPIVEKAVVVGGSSLFEESLFHPSFETLHLTQILHRDFSCDTFLTPKTISFLQNTDLEKYVTRSDIEEDGVEYRIVEFRGNAAKS